jgi:hypothetical protein
MCVSIMRAHARHARIRTHTRAAQASNRGATSSAGEAGWRQSLAGGHPFGACGVARVSAHVSCAPHAVDEKNGNVG